MQPNITNHGLNSDAATRFGITRHANIHPFYVLRQAELTVDSKKKEILEVELAIEQMDLAYKSWLDRLAILYAREQICDDRHLGWLFKRVRSAKNYTYKILRLPSEQQELHTIEGNVRRYDLERPKAERDLRDLKMELTAAEEEKQRFYLEHPDWVGKTYQEVQAEHSESAFLGRIAVSLAAHLYAGENHAAFVLLADLSHEQRLIVTKKAVELKVQVEGYGFAGKAYDLLQGIPVDERENFIAAAAALCRSNYPGSMQLITND
jgi:hypothetical protein